MDLRTMSKESSSTPIHCQSSDADMTRRAQPAAENKPLISAPLTSGLYVRKWTGEPILSFELRSPVDSHPILTWSRDHASHLILVMQQVMTRSCMNADT